MQKVISMTHGEPMWSLMTKPLSVMTLVNGCIAKGPMSARHRQARDDIREAQATNQPQRAIPS